MKPKTSGTLKRAGGTQIITPTLMSCMTINYQTRESRVQEFLDANPKPLEEKTAWVCFDEEVTEMFEAGTAYMVNPSEDTRAEFIKELADVQYTLSQLAIFYDVNLQIAFNRVADSNMSKVVEGQISLREDGKILKGPNYIPPDMKNL